MARKQKKTTDEANVSEAAEARDEPKAKTSAPKPRKRHKWARHEKGGRVCTVCGLREQYQSVAPGAGGRAVQIAGEEAWWIVARLPPCPTTPETEIEVGYAR